MQGKIAQVINECSDPSGVGMTIPVALGKKRHELAASKYCKFINELCSLLDEEKDPVLGVSELPRHDELIPFAPSMLLSFQAPSVEEVLEPRLPALKIMPGGQLPPSPTPSEEEEAPPSSTYEDRRTYYNPTFIHKIVRAAQDILISLVRLSEGMSECYCCVLESKPWVDAHDREITHVYVRLHFPFARINIKTQKCILYPALVRALRDCNATDELDYSPIGDWDRILEPIPELFPFYGCSVLPPDLRSRSRARIPVLTHIYGYISDQAIADHNPPECELDSVFFPEQHQYFISGLVPRDILSQEKPRSFWLPLFFSINFWAGVCEAKDGHGRSSLPGGGERLSEANDGLALAGKLLPLLGKHRFTEEIYWMEVGRALHHESKGSMEGCEIWARISEQMSPERGASVCRSRWRNMGKTGVTVKTIAWYAREDNPLLYSEWHDQWIHAAIENALDGRHIPVAEAIYRVFWLDYMCSSMERGGWLHFKGHQLRPIDDAVNLRNDITDIFVPLLRRALAAQNEQALRPETKDDMKRVCHESMKQINKLIGSLLNVSFRNAVISAARERFHVPDFATYLNANPERMGWENCVLEMCGYYAIPRPGKPEDYITKSTYIPYLNLTWQSPSVVKLIDWLRKVFPDDELFQEFLKGSASGLYGRNAEKRFWVWVGSGDNSKSMVVKLFQAAFGAYCIDLPPSILSTKTFSNSSAPSPELAQSKGAHFAIIAEPDADKDLDGNKIKQLTGGDRRFSRMLHDNGGSSEATHKLIFMTNEIPPIARKDKAAEDRFAWLPFFSKWVDDPPATPEEQYAQRLFKKDPFFERQIPELAVAFGWVLVQYYPSYKYCGLRTPEIVKRYAEDFWAENDPILCFMRECLMYCYKPGGEEKKELDPDVTSSATELYRPFKQWFTENFPKMPIFPQTRFRSELIRPDRLGKQYQRRWIGVKLKPVVASEGIARIME